MMELLKKHGIEIYNSHNGGTLLIKYKDKNIRT